MLPRLLASLRAHTRHAPAHFGRAAAAATVQTAAAAALPSASTSTTTSSTGRTQQAAMEQQEQQQATPDAGGPASHPQAAAAAAGAAAQPAAKRKFTIAVEGCCHGELDSIYATLSHIEATQGKKVDLLICCGDFQSVRNLDDLETMSCPVKYRAMMTFWKYYAGLAVAPVPTLFIGGNHEASNYLRELFYGGWAAPNIYFLGYSGCVRFGGHRIAGLSGTFVAPHYAWGHHERLPYDDKAVKSIYHVRQLHVHRLMQLSGRLSLFLSHDWPNRITQFGDKEWLYRKKPYFRAEAERGELGSPPSQQLLEALQPDYWFAAHLHVKFPAVVPHAASGANDGSASRGGGGGGDAQAAAAAAAGSSSNGSGGSGSSGPKVTRFLALDKCLPRRDFLQLIELDVEGPLQFEYDPEWLAVLRSTAGLMSSSRNGARLPPNWGGRAGPAPEDVAFVTAALAARGGAAIPANFVPTAPPYDPAAGARRGNMPRVDARNPQTEALLALLGLRYDLDLDQPARDSVTTARYTTHAAPDPRPATTRAPVMLSGPAAACGGVRYQPQLSLLSQQQKNPEEIDLSDSDDDDDGGDAAGQQQQQPAQAAAAAAGEDGVQGGALADGAPDSDEEAAAAGGGDAAAATALDDPMFGAVNTAAFPYLTK